nr:reverse transcriptase domain-containing protein [Tanacetum cinerariifolium]
MREFLSLSLAVGVFLYERRRSGVYPLRQRFESCILPNWMSLRGIAESVGDEELISIYGIGNRFLTNTKIKKDDKGNGEGGCLEGVKLSISESFKRKGMSKLILTNHRDWKCKKPKTFIPLIFKLVRQTRAKAVVAKVDSNSSTPAVSSDVAELKDMVRALLLDKKNQYSAQTSSPTPALIKAVEPNCVTCGGLGTLPGNTITNPKEDLKAPVQPTVTQSESETPVSEPVVAPVSAPMPNLKPSILYPSRRDNERRRDQANEQIKKFYEIFKEMSFEISFTDALMLMPKFASTLKALIGNKEKLSEMAKTLMNEHCSAVILNKLPKKLRDPGKFLIPCEFPGMDECLALADLDRTKSKPVGIAKDVKVKVGMFHFPTDLVVVDFEPDPQEAITYNLDQTSRYSANYDQMTANKIDVTDEACEEYSQEVLGFSDVTASGSPTHSDDPIVSTTFPTMTLFGDSNFLLFEEADAFLGLEDDPDSPELDPSYYDLEGDILSLEAILNTKTIKSSIDEPPEVELKDLPPHIEYAFLEGDNKLPIIIAKELRDEEKSALIKVLKSHKRAIAWKLSDIQGGFIVVANEENELIPTRLVTGWRVCIDYRKLNEATRKDHFPFPFMEQMLERLTGNEYYCFLDGFSGYFQIPIDPRDQEKTTFTCPYGTFAYRRMPFGLCNVPGTFQRCMLAIFHDMVEKTMEIFMDDFSVFGNSFENYLSRLEKMLQRCEDTKLCLNWERSHFMVQEGIVLGHKISKNGIEVDKAKINVIAKLPHPTTVKGVRKRLHSHAPTGRSPIVACLSVYAMHRARFKGDTPFVFSEYCIQAFQTLKKKLTEAPILIAPNWDLLFEFMCDASDFAIGAVLGQRHEKHFRPIHYASKTLTDAESNYTTTEKEMLAVVYAF